MGFIIPWMNSMAVNKLFAATLSLLKSRPYTMQTGRTSIKRKRCLRKWPVHCHFFT